MEVLCPSERLADQTKVGMENLSSFPYLERQTLLYLEFAMPAECADQFSSQLQPGNKDSGGL